MCSLEMCTLSTYCGLFLMDTKVHQVFPTFSPTTALLTLVNCMKVKWGAILQVISTVAKVLALIVVIIAGMIVLAQGRNVIPEFSF